ncbi:MAG: DNA primase [Gammaproteobacteria bacterium]
MSGWIPRQFIDDLLVRVDIVDLIDSHVPLKKVGNNFVARCPFHTEKTPSFSVNRGRQMYHCFGCGASGNAVSFLMDYSHLDFVEAVEDLAAFVGIDVPREVRSAYSAPVEKKELGNLYSVLEAVSVFYVEQLRSEEGKKAVDYLDRRGLSRSVASDFSLGYAPQRWDALIDRFDRNALIEAGMLVVRDDGKVYDRFRGRLMFPIRDKRQRVIGFGGRVLDNALPKYLNSPETAIFSKGKELYGLSELLQGRSRPEQIMVVEGYMDVISLAQYGIGNVVATLGTATSHHQVDLLFRYTSDLLFCFDGDDAGRKAAWKAVEIALASLRDGRQVRIMLLPQGQDPDSLIRAEGVTGFQRRIDGAQVLSDYFFGVVAEPLNLSTIEGRSQLLASAKPLLQKIPDGVFKEMMWKRLEGLSGVRAVDVPRNPSTLRPQVDIRRKGLGQRPSLIRRILALLIQDPNLACGVARENIGLDGLQFAGHELLEEVLQKIALEKPKNSAILIEAFRGSLHEKTVKALAALELNVPEDGKEAEFRGALTQLMRQSSKERLSALLAKEAHQGLTDEEKLMLRKLIRQS